MLDLEIFDGFLPISVPEFLLTWEAPRLLYSCWRYILSSLVPLEAPRLVLDCMVVYGFGCFTARLTPLCPYGGEKFSSEYLCELLLCSRDEGDFEFLRAFLI